MERMLVTVFKDEAKAHEGSQALTMNMSDLLRLPPGVMLGFAILIWPAGWATFLIIVSLAGDLQRQADVHPPAAWHKAA